MISDTACEECETAFQNGQTAFYRIGNQEIGYGNIGIIGCRKHIRLALDRLNGYKSDTPIDTTTKKYPDSYKQFLY